MTKDRMAGRILAVLHDPAGPNDPPDLLDGPAQARALAASYARLGCAPAVLPFEPDLSLMRRRLEELRPDAVVNVAESPAGLERLGFCVAALAEALRIPCTGNPAAALLACVDKSAVKRRLLMAGLPVAPWLAHAPRPGDSTPSFAAGPARFLLKPEDEHGSAGIDAGAEATAQGIDELRELLRRREALLRLPCLAEAYLPGREFAVSVLDGAEGPEALPVAEMRFLDPAETAVLTYDSKWREGSRAYAVTRRRFPDPDAEPRLLARLADLALAAWSVLGFAGCARFDFRLDAAGAPQIIDANPNPCLAPDAGFAAAAERGGIAYDAMARRLLETALSTPAATAPSPAGEEETRLRWRRKPTSGDAEAVRRLVAATGFFNAEEVAIAGELVQEHLAKGEASGYFFLFAEDDAGLAGYSCYGPTPGTQDGYDLYWIAVAPAKQGRGLGGRLLAGAEAEMAVRGAGFLYVETSSRAQYRPTRRFYERHGYVVAARLAGFYAAEDDKIIYRKRVRGARGEHS